MEEEALHNRGGARARESPKWEVEEEVRRWRKELRAGLSRIDRRRVEIRRDPPKPGRHGPASRAARVVPPPTSRFAVFLLYYTSTFSSSFLLLMHFGGSRAIYLLFL